MTLMQDARILAVEFDDVSLVRDQDESSVLSLVEQLKMAPFMKANVANHHRLINQKTIEFDRHGQCESQTRQHAVRVMQYRFTKINAKLGEFFDERYQRLVIDAIYAAYELQIIESGQMGLEGATKCERP